MAFNRSTGVILELDSSLGECCREAGRRLPAIGERHREDRIRMRVNAVDGAESAGLDWSAEGSFEAVLRQFRLDFLRYLTPDQLSCRAQLGIYHADLGGGGYEPALSPEPDMISNMGNGKRAEAAPAAAPEEHRSLLVDQLGRPLTISPVEQPGAGIPMPPLRPEPMPPASLPAAAAPPPVMPAPVPAPPTSSIQPRALMRNIYQEYFGLEVMPFNNTPDTHFFFPTEKHQEALSRLIYAISERKGFVMISGEIGAGKSTLCRMLLSQLPGEVKTALITQTHLDASQLVRAIAEDFGLDPGGRSHYEILELINLWLIEQLAAGCTPVLIIDEAQNLSPEVLEEIRMITNLETEQEKLLQLILLGQPELRDKLKLPQLRQLRQRIAVQFHLEPLTRQETFEYIEHRLRIANPTMPLHFRRNAMAEVFRYTGGVPRLINTICDHALLVAFTREVRQVTAKMIRESAVDMDLEPAGGDAKSFFRIW